MLDEKGNFEISFPDFLVEKKIISQEDIKKIITFQKEREGSFIDALIEGGYIPEDKLALSLSAYLSIPTINLSSVNIPDEVLKVVPSEIVEKYQVLPISKIADLLTLATANPLDVIARDDLERITKCKINPVIALRSQIKEHISKYYKKSLPEAVEEIIKGVSSEVEVLDEGRGDIVSDDDIASSLEDAPVVKLTNYILKRAVEVSASDVFIEPLEKEGRLRFRIDGVLVPEQKFSRRMHNFVISRIKVLSNLNITEHRLPQDGRFQMNILNRTVDFRVSVIPTISGEKITLRVLDRKQNIVDIDSLGFEEEITKLIKEDITLSWGMILVCGPTGSGKTSTLYSMLKYIYSPEKNIITAEDPIEYKLEGINQVNVNYDIGFTFASALRSFLRQDPDIIMVGEMRDFDTADISIKAALTGHLVFSTLHTTSACGSITRLINMGIEPFLIASTVKGVLAQRLLRRLCEDCKTPDNISSDLKQSYGIPPECVIYKAKGCKNCLNKGYKGRVAIGEYLHIGDQIRKIIHHSFDENVLKTKALSLGLQTLREAGLKKVKKGITSLEEVFRVTAK